MSKNALEFLKKHSALVLDSSMFLRLAEYKPHSVTTNPSLILQAMREKEYSNFAQQLIKNCPTNSVPEIIEQILIGFSKEILKLVPGNVSIELDADLAFNYNESVEQAERLMKLSKLHKIFDRILIKIPATWEGIQVLKFLSKRGIRCNMTLVFSLVQAALCSRSGAYVVSPFVGRVSDFYAHRLGSDRMDSLDPGVSLVKLIARYYQTINSNTKIMAASFRNLDQILSLVGCDFITISPNLVSELKNLVTKRPSHFINSGWRAGGAVKLNLVEEKDNFNAILAQNKLACHSLKEGVAKFSRDTIALSNIIRVLSDTK